MSNRNYMILVMRSTLNIYIDNRCDAVSLGILTILDF